jgi:hypothetical protein
MKTVVNVQRRPFDRLAEESRVRDLHLNLSEEPVNPWEDTREIQLPDEKEPRLAITRELPIFLDFYGMTSRQSPDLFPGLVYHSTYELLHLLQRKHTPAYSFSPKDEESWSSPDWEPNWGVQPLFTWGQATATRYGFGRLSPKAVLERVIVLPIRPDETDMRVIN